MYLSSLVRRGLFTASILAVAIVSGSGAITGAHAQLSPCRSDPVVSLLNLGQLDLNASIYDSMSDIRKVVYVVHAPAGTHLLSVINTDSLIGLRESVQFYADDARNTFDIYTTVWTGQSNIPIVASSTVISPLNLVLGLGVSTSGFSNHAIRTHFTTRL